MLPLQVIQSPMPGTLVHLAVEVGQEVNPGDEVRPTGAGHRGVAGTLPCFAHSVGAALICVIQTFNLPCRAVPLSLASHLSCPPPTCPPPTCPPPTLRWLWLRP